VKKILKIFGIVLASIVLLILAAFLVFSVSKSSQARKTYSELGEEAPVLHVDMEDRT
jgi:uncharacterized protein YpmB